MIGCSFAARRKGNPIRGRVHRGKFEIRNGIVNASVLPSKGFINLNNFLLPSYDVIDSRNYDNGKRKVNFKLTFSENSGEKVQFLIKSTHEEFLIYFTIILLVSFR